MHRSGLPRRRPGASGITSSTLQWILIVGGAIFILVQARILFSGTECTERVRALLESQRKWSQEARDLRLNLTALSRAAASVESQLHQVQAEYQQVSQDLRDAETTVEKYKQRLQEAKSTGSSGGAESAKGSSQGVQETVITAGVLAKPQSHPISAVKETEGTEITSRSPLIQRFVVRPEDAVAAVVVMVCNRPGYLQRTIKSILEVHKSNEKFPLFISQDGTHEEVKQLAFKNTRFQYMQHIEEKKPEMNSPGEQIAYYRIANHYKFAFSKLFDETNFSRVIVLEDDMELSPDFFDYFEATSNLLDIDPTLMAVSSWNDNGQQQFVSDPESLYRSDFFPGLGWMLRRQLWEELGPKWPKAYWDDWMRLPEVRRGRQSIRPEICRTYNFGEVGSSFGQFFRDFLAPIKLNTEKVDWRYKDLSYLLDVMYPQYFLTKVNSIKATMTVGELRELPNLHEDVIVEYTNKPTFASIAKAIGIFQEWKAGIPRTSYKGVVCVRYKGAHMLYIIDWSVFKSKPQ